MAKPAKKTSTSRLNVLQQKWQEATLCESHATTFEMPTGTYSRADETNEENVECDACTEVLMRRVGVL